MRQIKFKAWVDFGGEQGKPKMVKVSILHLDDDKRIGYKRSNGSMAYLEPIALMQFTGLLDENGREIYEGDIVKFPSYPTPVLVGEVFFKTIGSIEYCFRTGNGEFFGLNSKDAGCYEIIGTIAENPELLTSTKT